MKRIFCLLLAACLTVSLCGCGITTTTTGTSSQGDGVTSWSGDEDKNAENMAKEIIRCLIQKDQEALSALFCEPIRNRSSFAPELGCLYTKFHYDSYEGYRCDDIEAYYGKAGDREILRTLQAKVIYIEVQETDASGETVSKFYGLEWYWVLTCEENPSLVGIHQLTLTLLNTDQKVTVGNLDHWPKI